MNQIDNIIAIAEEYRTAESTMFRQALRTAIEQALGQGEPVAYQYRMRPTWGSRGANWGPWEECSRGKYEDCKKAPVVNDWEHEARALYTAPQPQREWVGLTDVEWMNIVNKNQAWFGMQPDEVAHEVCKLTEAKLRENNGGGV